jgi:uncharacterized peroxidase-related enzyme
MPHIDLRNDRPGIVGLFQYRPETAGPLTELTEVLLRGPSTLSRGERELIAAYVSALNKCRFCMATHATKAAAQLPGGTLPEAAPGDLGPATLAAAARAPKLQALLGIAAAVQQGGGAVTPREIAAARAAGAAELEIHDTVLIAAAFCMYNRYVDGLDAITPDDTETYARMAAFVLEHGYTAALEPA